MGFGELRCWLRAGRLLESLKTAKLPVAYGIDIIDARRNGLEGEFDADPSTLTPHLQHVSRSNWGNCHVVVGEILDTISL
jgi:hypothetical protein